MARNPGPIPIPSLVLNTTPLPQRMLRAQPRSLETHHVSMVRDVIAAACLGWYCFIVLVCGVGYVQLFRYYSKKPRPAACLTELPDDQIPHVTIIRPVKGLEPRLYECLAATFRQTYPKDKLTVYFCVAERKDPAVPILERLVREFEGWDAKIFVEEEDPALRGERAGCVREGEGNAEGSAERENGQIELGPNPKIRNMSRAYREAKGDIVWIIDCNVWVGKGVCGRMVDLLCGFGGKRRNKFVHQLPLVIDMDGEGILEADRKRLLNGEQDLDGDIAASSPQTHNEQSKIKRIWQRGGGRLEEMFMSSSHAKFYTAINTVLIAPCIVGKSNMFRRSHLDYLTTSNPKRSPGIDFFSDNICEDHLIGDALWKKPQAFELRGKKAQTKSNGNANGNANSKTPANTDAGPTDQRRDKFGKHALLFGDICIQPVSHTSVPSYIARRVRWLRVRKFTVTLATLVEPGTESILCSLYGAYAVSTLPFFSQRLGVPQTWSTFWLFWWTSMVIWCLFDWSQYRLIHSAKSVERDKDTPDFALPGRQGVIKKRYSPPASSSPSRQPLLNKAASESPTSEPGMGTRRTFSQYLCAWLGRELLAFPIWFWAVWGGVTVTWRGRRFWVGVDMKVHEIVAGEGKRKS